MMKSAFLTIAGIFCALGAGSSTVWAMGTAFSYQGRLHVSGDPAEGYYDFSFRIYDSATEGEMVGSPLGLSHVEVTKGYFTVSLDFGAAAFDGSPRWLEIWVAPYNPFLPLRQTRLSPRQPVAPVPYALCARSLSGTIDVSQITGLLGQGYSILFPDVLYNQVTLWVYNSQVYLSWFGTSVVLTGPGVDIDRIRGFDSQGRPADNPGFALEHPFIFEAAEPQAGTLRTYLDANPNLSPVLCAFNVPLLSGQDYLHLATYELTAQGYSQGTDGRTRFRFAMTKAPDRLLSITMLDPSTYSSPKDFGDTGAYNPATDRKVEIQGMTGLFFPEVALDEAERTLTMTYSSEEGAGIFGWVKAVVEGTNDQRSLSVAKLDGGGNVIEQYNYEGCFPLRYEIIRGFGLYTALQARVTLSYNIRIPAIIN